MEKRVFLGVGHGGRDAGAVGRVVEKDANLTIALEVKRILESYGVAVGISRTADEDDGLTEEIRECNAFAPDLAVEVHNNAGGGYGFEAFVQTNGYASQSQAAAKAIEACVIAMGQESRGLKTKRNSTNTGDYFGWLRLVKAPAVLCEGFFVDSGDAEDFDTAAKQQTLGAAYAEGILNYLGIPINREELDMAIYKTYEDVPAWGKEAVKLLMDKGALVGTGNNELNISDDLVRVFAVLHRLEII